MLINGFSHANSSAYTKMSQSKQGGSEDPSAENERFR